MRKIWLLLIALLGATMVAFGQGQEKSLEIDAASFAPVQTDVLSGVAIDKIGLDLSRRPCARIKLHINRMTREEIDGLSVKPIGGNVIVMRRDVAVEGNGLIIEMTAKSPTRFYLHHDEFGDSNEVSLNLEGDKEYRLEAELNQFYPITVTSNVKDAEVYIDDRMYGKTNDEFYLLIHDILPGEHTLRVEHAGRRSEQKILVHKESLVFRCSVEEADAALDWLVFQLTPGDATLVLDGKVMKVVSGIAQTMLLRGSYEYEVSKSDYHTERGVVVMDGDKVVKQVKLRPAFGWLTINSNDCLLGAAVYIDDKQIGTVPLIRYQVDSGTHTISLLKANYKPYTSTFVLSDSQHLTLHPEMVDNSAPVTLVAEAGVEIWINEKRVATSCWEGRLEPGAYKVECKREGCTPTSQLVNVETLLPLKVTLEVPQLIVGSVNITSDPAMAKIYIDDKPYGETPMVVDNIAAGDHKLRLEIDGYQPYEMAVTVRENKTEMVTAKMYPQEARVEEVQRENSTGLIAVRFRDSRTQASVYLDGTYLGASNSSYRLPQGQHALVVRFGDKCYGEVVNITPYTHSIDLSASGEVASPDALSTKSKQKGGKSPKGGKGK